MSKRAQGGDDPPLQAEAVAGAERGALIVGMFGAGWLG